MSDKRTAGMLAPAPDNPRKITPERLRMLGDSMVEFGDLSGITFNRRTQRLIAGHQRMKHIPDSSSIEILREFDPPTQSGTVAFGILEVAGEFWWYREVDVDEDREKAMNISPNAHGGEWDIRDLIAQVSYLDGEGGFPTSLVGFTDEDVETWLNMEPKDKKDGDDFDIQIPDQPSSVTGEVYELGDHRLVCGDATDPGVLELLMQGRPIDCIWTDPPYGVNYVGRTKDKLTIQHDDPDIADALLLATLQALTPFVVENAPYYICCPATGSQGIKFSQAIVHAGWRIHQTLIWCKNHMVLGHSDYHYKHESIFYGWAPGEGRANRGGGTEGMWYGDNAQTSVFHIDRPSRSEDHPTMKPVALIDAMIQNSSQRGSTVIDPFAGSGSTLIAGHDAGRLMYMADIDPKYCDVVRQRYASHTGDESFAP